MLSIIKSGFKYFFKSKIVVAIISLIILISTIFFSTIFITSNNMFKSLDNVKQQTSSHDLTIDDTLKPVEGILVTERSADQDSSFYSYSLLSDLSDDPFFLNSNYYQNPNFFSFYNIPDEQKSNLSEEYKNILKNNSFFFLPDYNLGQEGQQFYIFKIPVDSKNYPLKTKASVLDVLEESEALYKITSYSNLNELIYKGNLGILDNSTSDRTKTKILELYKDQIESLNSKRKILLEKFSKPVFTIIKKDSGQETFSTGQYEELSKPNDTFIFDKYVKLTETINSNNQLSVINNSSLYNLQKESDTFFYNKVLEQSKISFEYYMDEVLNKVKLDSSFSNMKIEEISDILTYTDIHSKTYSLNSESNNNRYQIRKSSNNEVSSVFYYSGSVNNSEEYFNWLKKISLNSSSAVEFKINFIETLNSIYGFTYSQNYQFIYEDEKGNFLLSEKKVNSSKLNIKIEDLFERLKTIFPDESSYRFEIPLSEEGSSLLPSLKKITFFQPMYNVVGISYKFSLLNNIQPVNFSFLGKYYDISGKFKSEEFVKDNPNSFLTIGEVVFPVIFIATSIDTIAPILTYDKLIPNYKEETVVYASSVSFSYSELNLGTETNEEKYKAMKYNDNLSQEQKNHILDIMKDSSNKYFKSFNGVNAVRDFQEVNILGNLSALRIKSVYNIYGIVRIVSLISLISFSLITLFIIFVVLKRKLSNLKKTLGILEASGYLKSQIALILVLGPSSLVFLFSAVGYLVGFAFQKVSYSIFDDLWPIDVPFWDFDLLPFFLTIFIPAILTAIFSYLTSLILLRGSVLSKIHSESKVSWFGILLGKIVIARNPRNSFALSLFGANIFKMLILSFSLGISVSVIAISASISGKFEKSKKSTLELNNFSYKTRLITPTLQGGQYSPLYVYSSSPESTYILGSSNNKNGSRYLNFPNPSSAINLFNQIYKDPQSLNHYAIFEPSINLDPSDSFLPFNPWSLFSQRIPESILKQIETKSEYFKNTEGYLESIDKNSYYNNSTNRLKAFEDKKPTLAAFNSIPVDNDDLLYSFIESNSEKYGDLNIDGIIQHNYFLNKNLDRNEKYYPIQTKYSEEYDKLIEKEIEFFEDVKNNKKPVIPVLINQFVKDKFFIGVGKKFEISVENLSARYIPNNISDKKFTVEVVGVLDGFSKKQIFSTKQIADYVVNNKYIRYFDKSTNCNSANVDNCIIGNEKIEDVTKTYFDHTKDFGYIIENKYLVSNNNNITSTNPRNYLSDFFSDNNFYSGITIPELYKYKSSYELPIFFNGVISHSSNITPHQITSFSLYSESGIYPATIDSFSSGTKSSKDLLFYKSEEGQNYLEKLKLSLGNDITWEEVYSSKNFGDYFFYPSLKDYEESRILEFSFSSTSKLAETIISIFVFITLTISLLFTLVMGIIIVEENKDKIVMLKILGFSNKELSSIFANIYVPSILLSILVSISSFYLLSILLKSLTMFVGQMTISLPILWLPLIIIFVSTFVFALLVYWHSLFSLKKFKLIEI